jgi:E3 ubiquitin-protein ligase Topors
MSLPGPSRRPPERAGDRAKEEPDELDIQVDRRREIYYHELYVKVSSKTDFT